MSIESLLSRFLDHPLAMLGFGFLLLLLVTLLYRQLVSERQLRRRLLNASGLPLQTTEDVDRNDDYWESFCSDALIRAGVEISPARLLGIAVLSSAAGGLASGLALSDTTAAAIGMIIGFSVPLVILSLLARNRRRRLQNQIPDAFYLLARAMRAGSGLERSLALCAEQTDLPLKDELQRALNRIDLGLSVSHSLTAMGDRMQLEDMDMLIATIQVHQTTGGDLARLIDRVATAARSRNEFRLQVKSATSMSRISAIFISAAQPVILLIYALSPQSEILTSFLSAPEGKVALGISILLEIVGVLWLLAILRVKF